MKRSNVCRLLTIVLLASLFAILATATALANNGPHRGPGWSAIAGGVEQNPDGCAGCHRAHTGTNPNSLLKEGSNETGFCRSCHSATGNGANTDVENGQFTGIFTTPYAGHDSSTDGDSGTPKGSNPKGLNGGGFIKAVSYTDRSGRAGTPANITSRHDVVGLPLAVGETDGDRTAYGAAGSPDFSLSSPFKCSSCHNPHGVLNSDGSERYRILNNVVAGTAVNAMRSFEEKNKDANGYTIKDYTKDQYKFTLGSGNDGNYSDFCQSCHRDYKDGSAGYRHPMDGANLGKTTITGNGATVVANMNANVKLPLIHEDSQANADTLEVTDKMTCLTCHQAHGSGVAMDLGAQAGISQGANDAGNYGQTSALLRLKNRGVCQDCHQK